MFEKKHADNKSKILIFLLCILFSCVYSSDYSQHDIFAAHRLSAGTISVYSIAPVDVGKNKIAISCQGSLSRTLFLNDQIPCPFGYTLNLSGIYQCAENQSVEADIINNRFSDFLGGAFDVFLGGGLRYSYEILLNKLFKIDLSPGYYYAGLANPRSVGRFKYSIQESFTDSLYSGSYEYVDYDLKNVSDINIRIRINTTGNFKLFLSVYGHYLIEKYSTVMATKNVLGVNLNEAIHDRGTEIFKDFNITGQMGLSYVAKHVPLFVSVSLGSCLLKGGPYLYPLLSPFSISTGIYL
jgi:hypothetical protein